MKRVLLAASILCLASCGGGDGGRALGLLGCDLGTHSVQVQLGTVPPGAGAETTTRSPCESIITVLSGLPEDQTAAILVHELWHAADHQGFHNGEGCYTAPIVFLRIPEPPCPVELAQMQSVGGTFEVTVLSPGLLAATQNAVSFWNEHVGREMFRMQE